ncbi:MAG: polymorphic toxin-type HINT domain-containing protein, partial [Lacipirellulaceae bacterium]
RDHVEAHPEMALGGGQHRLEQAILEQQPRALARGVAVWTLQGQRPVEKLRIGDFVLSQDVRTGELAYKPILAMNAYPEMEMQRVQLRTNQKADDAIPQEIVSGEGQVFFRAGQGWRRMSDLTSDSELHGLTMAVTFQSSEETYAMDAYNIVVADFHTLFIGSQGLLTHDGTPVGATAQAQPGFPRALAGRAKQVAQAK